MKTILIISFLLISSLIYSQQYSGVLILKQASNDSMSFNLKDTSIVKQCDIEYLRYCLNKYQKSRSDGFWWMGASCLCGLMYINSTGDEKKIFGSLTMIGLAGSGIILARSEKYIKQAAIKPTSGGVGFVVEF